MPLAEDLLDVADPRQLQKLLWPQVTFYREQWRIIYSVWYDRETIVTAGNMLGKDFVGGFIVPAFFLTRMPCKIVTTSVKEKHLDVLWGEIDKFLRLCRFPLSVNHGGPLKVNNDGMRRLVDGQEHKGCYVLRLVATDESIESFQGHHVTPDPGQPIDNIPRNLFVSDEASGMKDKYYTMAKTWAKRVYLFGNTWPCENYFKRSVKGDPQTGDPGGDILSSDGNSCLRRVIRVRAEDSPNVRLAKVEVDAGKKPSGKVLIPGVLEYEEYLRRRKYWPKSEQTVSLDADWYEGVEEKMFPRLWIDLAEEYAKSLHPNRKAGAVGQDSAEGGDNTSMAAADMVGLIDLVASKTPDTNVIPGSILSFARQHGVPSERIYMDAGGGGKEHGDRLRAKGHQVQLILFGGSALPAKRRGMRLLQQRVEEDETRYVYRNKRSEMYHTLRLLLEPVQVGETWVGKFGLPTDLIHRPRANGGPSLAQQMLLIPLWHDEEGRIFLPSKHRRPDAKQEGGKPTLTEILGCSPDELDAVVLAVYGMVQKATRPIAGVIV